MGQVQWNLAISSIIAWVPGSTWAICSTGKWSEGPGYDCECRRNRLWKPTGGNGNEWGPVWEQAQESKATLARMVQVCIQMQTGIRMKTMRHRMGRVQVWDNSTNRKRRTYQISNFGGRTKMGGELVCVNVIVGWQMPFVMLGQVPADPKLVRSLAWLHLHIHNQWQWLEWALHQVEHLQRSTHPMGHNLTF